MKIMKFTCALLLTAWMSSANATLIFDFSFTDVANGNGVITGEILGLSDNATGAATSVRVLTNTGGFGIGEYVGNPLNNNFTVFSGEITFYDFLSFGVFNLAPAVQESSFIFWDKGVGMTNLISEVHSTNFTAQSFVITQRNIEVPEPGTVILLFLGLAGLSFARYRRQS